MGQKLRVAVLFGGKTAEHEVSLQSAKNVIEAMDKTKYEVIPVGIDKQGHWLVGDLATMLLDADNPKLIRLNQAGEKVALMPGADAAQLIPLAANAENRPVDVVFPVLHGPLGEDGTVQGLLKLADVPFVGCGVLGSATGMDKDIMKRLLRDAAIANAKFVTVRDSSGDAVEQALEKVGLPCFVKPANMGSSVGISKVKTRDELAPALERALQFDHKVIVEEFIEGREIECSVLGNLDPIASLPGEIVPQHEFYSYEAKYIDENGALLKVPAELTDAEIARIQETAVETFLTLGCEGMARVDFFLRPNGALLVNEVNTIPGFTKISMYPKLWGVSGIGYSELIDRLIELALERHRHEQKLKTSFD